VLEAMRSDSELTLEALRVDGGAARNDLLMQFQADILGVPVQRPTINETTALGAAFLAGLAVKLWPSLEAISDLWRKESEFVPTISEDHRQTLFAQWKRAVERSRAWIEV
jgi:glycerol kinase